MLSRANTWGLAGAVPSGGPGALGLPSPGARGPVPPSAKPEAHICFGFRFHFLCCGHISLRLSYEGISDYSHFPLPGKAGGSPLKTLHSTCRVRCQRARAAVGVDRISLGILRLPAGEALPPRSPGLGLRDGGVSGRLKSRTVRSACAQTAVSSAPSRAPSCPPRGRQHDVWRWGESGAGISGTRQEVCRVRTGGSVRVQLLTGLCPPGSAS